MAPDYDVVVVGGGPGGCAAGVFTARAGLDTLLFDRGRSSIARCAHLTNYLGFPAGVDTETFAALCRDHAETAGCVFEPDLVESVERLDAGDDSTPTGFRVHPQSGAPVTATRVVTATRYDADYLRGLDAAADLFADAPGDDAQVRDDCADHDGTTPVAGLYVVSPSPEDTQALTVAGRGARVGQRVVADARVDDGWWAAAAETVDWTRRAAELDDEWADRERWVAWFDDHHADAPVSRESARFRRVRRETIDEARDSYIDAETEAARAERGQARLAGHLDPAAVVDGVGADRLLDAMDDETLRAHLDRETVVGD